MQLENELVIAPDDLDRLLTMLADPGPGRNYPAEITEFLARMEAQLHTGHQPADAEPAAETPDPAFGDGEFKRISFMGRITHTGLVTEIIKHGQPAYHIDLPERLWGGNPDAWVEHSAAAWFSEEPISEQAVRVTWETGLRRRAMQAERERLWREQQQTHALEAGDGDPDEVWDGEDDDDDDDEARSGL